MCSTSLRNILQYQNVISIQFYIQISVQDVFACSFNSFFNSQKKEASAKVKPLINRPWQEIKTLLKGFLKSMLFSGCFTLITRRTMCFLAQYYQFTGFNGSIGAFLGGVTLNFESIGRQSQIALFCLNKTMQTLYNMALRRDYPVKVPYGECIIAGIAIGIICYHFVDCEKAIRENYKKILEKIIGNM